MIGAISRTFLFLSLVGTLPAETNDAPRLQAMILEAQRSGQKKITIPPGTYRLAAPEGARASLSLSGLRDLEIDATGVELIGTDRKSTMIFFERCENVILRGARLRYDPLPFSQGRIETVALDGKSLDIRIMPGYPSDLDDARYYGERGQIIANIFDADTRLWRRDVADVYGTEFVQLEPDLFRLIMASPLPKADLIGSPIAWRGNGTADIRIYQSARMQMLDLDIRNAIGFCIHESGGEGGSFYRYKVTRGPAPAGATEAPLFSANADAFHSSNVRRGPTLEDCVFEYTDDDGIPIHGAYALVADAKNHTLATLQKDFCREGDTLKVYDEAGAYQGTAKVTGFTLAAKDFQPQPGYNEGAHAFQDVDRITYAQVDTDKPLELKEGWRVANIDALGSGFVIRRCTIRHVRARGILVKASDGLIEDNVIEGTTMAGIALWPEMGHWDESDFSQRVTIRRNTLRDVGLWNTPGNGMAGALTVGAREGGNFVASQEGHRDIVIENNVFENNGGVNILLSTTQGVQVRGNTFLTPMTRPTTRGAGTGVDPASLIWITEALDVTLSHNTLTDPGKYLRERITITPPASEITQGEAFLKE